MENFSVLLNPNSSIPTSQNWCAPWTRPVNLYGLIIPGIALFIFGLTFNPIALYYFATSRNFRRSAYSYYFSAIAVVDLVRLTTWFLFLLFDYQIFKLRLYPFECSIQIFLEAVTSSISAWLTVSLTVERCLVIYKPLQTLTDTKGKRALILIFCVILASCAVNSLILHPKFYGKRIYIEEIQSIICDYDATSQEKSKGFLQLTPDNKRYYLLFTVIIRVVVPFLLLLTANIVLFESVRRSELELARSQRTFLVRHGHHRQITPMIFFSSGMLLLTISPRYLVQFYVNFFRAFDNCTLMHFAPHLLKTMELFNYSFNVFVSIVSGKHGRHELFNMLLCRTQSLRLKSHSPALDHSSVSTRSPYQQRSNLKSEKQINATQRLLLTSEYS